MEDMGTLGEVGKVDPSLGSMTQFGNVVELYQKKNHKCFGCRSPDLPVKDCPKELGKTSKGRGFADVNVGILEVEVLINPMKLERYD